MFSSAFYQSCGFITVHIPNVEYTPGYLFKGPKKKKIMLNDVVHTNMSFVCSH